MFTQTSKSYPFLIPPEYWPEKAHLACRIKGDVFQITQTQQERCDTLEGHPDYYVRTPIAYHISNAMFEVEAYILTEKTFKEMDKTRFVVLSKGDWLLRNEK